MPYKLLVLGYKILMHSLAKKSPMAMIIVISNYYIYLHLTGISSKIQSLNLTICKDCMILHVISHWTDSKKNIGLREICPTSTFFSKSISERSFIVKRI